MECILATKQAHFYDQILVRKEVFIIEQKVPIDEEYDELDKTALQFVVYDNDKAVGAARLRFIETYGKVERVCVLKDYRKKGVGKLLMDTIEEYANNEKINTLKLNAQLTAIPFYEKLGFEAYGEIFLDADIEHKAMLRTLK